MSTWTVPSYAEGWTVPGFTEQQELGRSAYGRVAEAVRDGSGHRVAIKYLSPALAGDPAFMRRFRAEARALSQLRIPQVAQVYDYVEQPGSGAAVITELVNGVSLREMIERRGPVSPEAALAVLKGTLLALAAAHALGIGHRDCKPENVLADTEGSSRLTDFGWAVRPDAQSPPAGMPPYLAPELWRGASESPATDLYAATAVFFYGLAGQPPFSGALPQLREQHATAAVPVELIDPPLRRLVVQGMAKDPARRQHSAIAFASELEAVAASAYGPDWEERGRAQLAERAAAMLPLPRARHASASTRPPTPAGTAAGGGGRRRVLAITAAAAAAVLVIGGVAAAVTLKDKGAGHATASLSGASSQGMPVTPSFTAVANVTPPVTVSKCTTPTSFTYTGTLTATAPGTVTYRWVYSSGKAGPEQAASFIAAGDRQVTGETVSTKTVRSGWGEIKVISPVARTSNEAAYKLLCGGGSVGGVTVSATVQPATRTVSCVTAPPAFTATGSIRAARAETVTYYWARSDGASSAPATLTFTGPGTQSVKPLTISPPGASGPGEAVLVVTSPVATASSPAVYTLTCKAPVTQPTTRQTAPPTTSHTVPATVPASPKSSSSGRLHVITRTVALNAVRGTAYSGYITVSGGTGPYTWGAVAGLPPGLTATANGDRLTVSGTPAEVGTFNPTLSVKDSSSPPLTSTNSFTVYVLFPSLTVTVNAAKTATAGQPYSGTVTVTGGDGNYTWSAVAGLPPGLTATANGATLAISGSPALQSLWTISGQVSDGEGQTLEWVLNLTLSWPPITLTGNMPATATVGQPYLGQVTAAGGDNGEFTWSVGGFLPPGLKETANGATLTISGTPTSANSPGDSVYVQVNQGVAGASRSYPILVSPAS
jgi:serine/threonine-protein kinase